MQTIKELVSLSHQISRHVVGAEGNTSAREGDYFYIKASGFSLDSLQESDVIKCDLDGNQLNNFHLKPSLETSFHSLIYKISNCRFIAHTHPLETMKIVCSKRVDNFSKERLFPDQVVYNGLESCVIEYSHPGIELRDSMAVSLSEYIKRHNNFPDLILLKNHGIICAADTIKKCVFSTDICEKSAAIFTSSELNFLTFAEKQKIIKDKNEKYRRNRA